MEAEKIKVTSYSGGRGEESPRSFFIGEEKIDVIEILTLWIEEGLETGKRKRFFKVKGSDGCTHTLFYDEQSMDWFLKK